VTALRRRATRLLTLALLIGAAPLHAQRLATHPTWTMPAGYKEIQLRAQETQRDLLLAMADSMPERLYRDAATPEQRDFARQVHHAANADVYIVSHYVRGDSLMPFPADTAQLLNSRAGLKAFINAAYDYSMRVLRNQSAEDRETVVWYFGQKIPKWLIWDELNQHTIWTVGQIVANFRKHEMAPPAFSYY
jgi:hypothetical protein